MIYTPAIQLFTVRNALQNDFRGTLTSLAAMGYRAVEFAWNYGGLAPDELAATLTSLNLDVCGFYLRAEDLLDPDHTVYDYVRAAGASFVTVGAAGDVQDDWRGAIRTVAASAAVARDQGVTLVYHNHGAEFDRIEGRTALDILLEETDPELVKAEIDIGFAFQRGVDPAALIRRYGSRVCEVHLRDLPEGGDEFVELGHGRMDLADVLAAAHEVGARWAIVEQSVCDDELESARISLETFTRLEAAHGEA